MPEALATSKRKFYKFLDNLSAPPNSTPPPTTTPRSKRPLSEASQTNASNVSVLSTASKAARIEPTAKRLRPSTSSTTVNSLRTLHVRNASNTSLSSIRLRHAIASDTKSTDALTESEKKTPHFSPWSHETFLQRLQTFASVTQWHPKPDAVNEVEWAKRGWQCVEVNTVGCRGGCGKRVVVRLDPLERKRIAAVESEVAYGDNEDAAEDLEQDSEDDLDTQFEVALVAKYKDLILDGHGESCLWRKAGCKDDIYRLPVVRTSIWQTDVKSRYQALLSTSDSITNITLKTPDAEPSTSILLRDLPTHILASPSERSETQHRALTLALTGWTAQNESRTPILSCAACFQRLGLWLYQPEYVRPPSSHSDLEDEDRNDSHVLDPVEMHREHCPWRNGTNQAATGEYKGQPAWKILWSVVGRYADEQRRRSRVGIVVHETVSRAATPVGEEEAEQEADREDEEVDQPQMSREEIQRLDKERTTKLRKLKRMFSVKKKAPAAGS